MQNTDTNTDPNPNTNTGPTAAQTQPDFRTGVREPYRVAPDTFVIPELVPGPPGTVVALNSMVITGREPVIVDTGNELSRDAWLEAAFSIVDPADVRWVFLSHDDHDHIGNLPAVLQRCPRATLITNWFTMERTSRAMELPLARMRWVNSGESFDAGDRTLVALRPPVFDSPTTRGLYDAKTGVYWAVDTFAALSPGFITEADDCPSELWEESFVFFNQMVSPWTAMIDAAKFNATIEAVAALGATTITGGHTAALRGQRLQRAMDLLRRLPHLPEAQVPGQADLDAILAAHAPLAA
ncbi:MAG: MBL fold metallo-hydrolase [Acidimicrobiales bacterium]